MWGISRLSSGTRRQGGQVLDDLRTQPITIRRPQLVWALQQHGTVETYLTVKDAHRCQRQCKYAPALTSTSRHQLPSGSASASYWMYKT